MLSNRLISRFEQYPPRALAGIYVSSLILGVGLLYGGSKFEDHPTPHPSTVSTQAGYDTSPNYMEPSFLKGIANEKTAVEIGDLALVVGFGVVAGSALDAYLRQKKW